MNYNSVIKPDAMISQCNEMLLMFEQDNDSIQTVWNAFNQFIGDSEIESEAFHALKQRVSDYLTVLQSMKIANEMDMEDCRNFSRLMEAVGGNIIGSDVLDGKEAAKQDMLDHDALADKNASKAKHTSKPLKWYYECQKKYYEMLAENDEDIYNEWRRMEETYDEIDVASANYFIRGNQVRTMAASALQELKQLSIDNSSTPMSSVYINTLQGICTTYDDTFDKGNISEKEKYQIKSWIETDYKLSDEELEVAKEYIDKYFKENKQANQLLNSKTATAAAAIRNQMSVEEFKEYQMMAALYNKTSKWNGFWLGVIDAIPFLTEVIDWSDSMVCEMEEKQTVKNATLSSIMENVRCQNPVAYGSGYAASLAAQPAAINGLLESGEGAEIAEVGNDTVAYHSVGGDNSAKKIQSVLDGIDISYTSPESRFGQGFYVAADGDTTIAELAYHGTYAQYSIRYEVNLEGQKVLDLTDPLIADKWGFSCGKSSLLECQNIAEAALDDGYDVIKVQSYRDKGINYVIYNNFDEILKPQMVTPIGD